MDIPTAALTNPPPISYTPTTPSFTPTSTPAMYPTIRSLLQIIIHIYMILILHQLSIGIRHILNHYTFLALLHKSLSSSLPSHLTTGHDIPRTVYALTKFILVTTPSWSIPSLIVTILPRKLGWKSKLEDFLFERVMDEFRILAVTWRRRRVVRGERDVEKGLGGMDEKYFDAQETAVEHPESREEVKAVNVFDGEGGWFEDKAQHIIKYRAKEKRKEMIERDGDWVVIHGAEEKSKDV